ncbi:hypothetical protein [Acinetobacter pollinis]|uniref:Uncharacterized protein n=1 Tax=Acinetobacter pollinis TaxID=2605270 RepID=A0ABU6DV33_9GAMM|nr:hypothetical protein [Acinetobacter pollinis]MEB5477527.1 hypothetical protein [Acinetobacter pollinis]
MHHQLELATLPLSFNIALYVCAFLTLTINTNGEAIVAVLATAPAAICAAAKLAVAIPILALLSFSHLC